MVSSSCPEEKGQNHFYGEEVHCLISKRTQKFVLELPKMVNEVHAFNKKNRNTLSQDAIQKEMKNVKIAFHIISEDKKPPGEFQYVNCYMVFDIKMADFWRK